MQIVSKFNENKIQPTENEVSNLGHGKSKYALHFIAHNVEREGGILRVFGKAAGRHLWPFIPPEKVAIFFLKKYLAPPWLLFQEENCYFFRRKTATFSGRIKGHTGPL